MEAIAIIKAVQGGYDVISQFTSLCNRYIQLPSVIHDIDSSLSGCEHALASWKRRWGVQEHHPTRYYETLWGRNGWQEIRLCLGGIRETSNQLNDKIFKLVGSATKFSRRQAPRDDAYESWYDEELLKESVKRIARSTSRWKRFAGAFGDQATELQGEIRRFDQQLRNLRRMSNGNAENIHGEEFQRIRHLRGPDLVRLVTGRPFRNSRKDAQLLYNAFRSSRGLICNLGLTVQGRNARPPSRSPSGRRYRSRSPRPPIRAPPDPEKDFQMFLFDGIVGMEVLIHPVRFAGSPNRDLFCSTFEHVTRELVQNDATEPCNLLTPDSSYEEGFSISRAADAGFATLIQRPRGAQNFEGQSLQDKIIVANTLAEACCRLLGSSWLDYLEIGNLRGHYCTPDRTTWAGMLDAESGDRRTAEALERVANMYRRGEHSIAQHCHIYRLGLVLTEIALGTEVNYLVYDRRDGVNVVIQDISDQPLDRYRIATAVEVETNPKFGDIVFFCLSVLQDQRALRAKDLDDDLMSKILEPLKDQVKVVRAAKAA
ncbi:hypothetical protein K432DRAFT_396305 [Lepidopterella palustris CBS 459.81]|uniref:Uncharacterized protein n=1 Tax=Lepidopterella palustris CBS 459.81 TaxID=1314670 RepID=A0A8E2E3I1_9PEZI|nr:hypothetical protein K432DRAFT_396305 [Lepidopterella palustris CBS 459.81]